MFEYEEFTRNRITGLRMHMGISARDMSLSLGQSENRKALPSLQSLFNICEYFHITPKEFFDEGSPYPDYLAALIEDLKKLDAAELEASREWSSS